MTTKRLHRPTACALALLLACAALLTGGAGTASAISAPLVQLPAPTPSFTRSYDWTLAQRVTPSRGEVVPGTTSAFRYTVDTGATAHDAGWRLAGVVVVTNPAAETVEVVSVRLTDLTGHGSCTIDAGHNHPVNVAPGATTSIPYGCSFTTATSTPAPGTLRADVEWDVQIPASPVESATVDYAFTTPTTTVHPSATVTDTLGSQAVVVGTFDAAHPGSAGFTRHLGSGVAAGTCGTFGSRAAMTYPDDAAPGPTAQSSVEVCSGAPPATKVDSATPSFTRTHTWRITKKVDKSIRFAKKGSVTFTYTVGLGAGSPAAVDSGWKVKGSVQVSNPNQWQAVTATSVRVAATSGGTCTVAGGPRPVVAPGATVSLPYVCAFASKPSPAAGDVTATAAWDAASAATSTGSATSAPVPFAFGTGAPGNPTVKKATVSVQDNFVGTLGPVTAGKDRLPKTFVYQVSIPVPSQGCTPRTNTATIVQTGQHASVTVRACRWEPS